MGQFCIVASSGRTVEVIRGRTAAGYFGYKIVAEHWVQCVTLSRTGSV
jgi:hypothetical protein